MTGKPEADPSKTNAVARRAGEQVGGKKIEQCEECKPETGSTNSVNHLLSSTETTLGHQFRARSSLATTHHSFD